MNVAIGLVAAIYYIYGYLLMNVAILLYNKYIKMNTESKEYI